MSQLTVEDLQARLHDAEESANRFIQERDAWAKEAAHYKRIALDSNARNPESSRLKTRIEELVERLRLQRMQTENAKLEIKLLKSHVKLLKAKRDASSK